MMGTKGFSNHRTIFQWAFGEDEDWPFLAFDTGSDVPILPCLKQPRTNLALGARDLPSFIVPIEDERIVVAPEIFRAVEVMDHGMGLATLLNREGPRHCARSAGNFL
jgi:hypothetical protein